MGAGASIEQGAGGADGAPPQASGVLHPIVQPQSPGSATLTVPTALGLSDGGASNGGVWVTAPQATRHRWEKCPHHAGECPGCGEKVKDLAALLAAKPSRVPKALSAADPALAKTLDKLLDAADADDQADLAFGGGQQMFKRLKKRLPAKVRDPGRPKPKGWLQALWWAFSPPPTPSTDAKDVLDRAKKAHLITEACCAASEGLPLEGEIKDASAETRKAMAAFLVRLAEQITAPRPA